MRKRDVNDGEDRVELLTPTVSGVGSAPSSQLDSGDQGVASKPRGSGWLVAVAVVVLIGGFSWWMSSWQDNNEQTQPEVEESQDDNASSDDDDDEGQEDDDEDQDDDDAGSEATSDAEQTKLAEERLDLIVEVDGETIDVQFVDADGEPTRGPDFESGGQSLVLLYQPMALVIDPASLSATSVALSPSLGSVDYAQTFGENFVLLAGSSGIWALPIQDLGAEPVRLGDQNVGIAESGDPGKGVVVRWDSAGDVTHRDVIDLYTGEALGSLRAPKIDSVQYFLVDHDLANVGGSGIYDLSGDKPRFISTGAAISSSESLLLVQRCDDQLVCAGQWWDRTTGEQLPYPDIDVGFGATIDPSERWIVAHDSVGSMSLFEIRTGLQVEVPEGSGFVGEVVVSSNGRWLAQGTGSFVVTDLDHGGSYRVVVKGDSLGGRIGILFGAPATTTNE